MRRSFCPLANQNGVDNRPWPLICLACLSACGPHELVFPVWIVSRAVRAFLSAGATARTSGFSLTDTENCHGKTRENGEPATTQRLSTQLEKRTGREGWPRGRRLARLPVSAPSLPDCLLVTETELSSRHRSSRRPSPIACKLVAPSLPSRTAVWWEVGTHLRAATQVQDALRGV